MSRVFTLQTSSVIQVDLESDT